MSSASPLAGPTPGPGRRHVLGMDLDPLTLRQACDRCSEAVRARKPVVVGVLNAAKIVKVQRDERLRTAVAGCDLVLADGLPVVWASRLLGRPLPERVAGIDLFVELLREADRHGWSIYLLGATEEVLADLVRRIRRDHPGLRIAGRRNGYFGPDEEEDVAAGIRAAEPDVLFVGISTPTKELFLQRFGHSLGVPVCHGVGGAFDVLAGKVERAPESWQRLGLEWLYRVLQEPLRLWKRYLTTNSAFVWLVAREWVRGRLAPRRP